MDIESFVSSMRITENNEELIDFCRKKILHGIPYIFKDNEDSYYEFRKRVAEKFNIDFHEVYISGSAKLGFSPHKLKLFDLESDIDVAIVSISLYEKIMHYIQEYQMNLRSFRRSVSEREINMYHNFLEYVAIGWIRPDKLPYSFQVNELKSDWFDFFDSLSYGKSEVGNHKVSAGVFKSYAHFEYYTSNSLVKIRKSIEIGKDYDSSN